MAKKITKIDKNTLKVEEEPELSLMTRNRAEKGKADALKVAQEYQDYIDAMDAE